MGGRNSKSSADSVSKIPINIPSYSAAPSVHPCRLMEFGDIDVEMRVLAHITDQRNRSMNSPFVLPEEEANRRPDPRTLLLLTPKILKEVEQALIEYMTVGFGRHTKNSGACISFKGIHFKKSTMQKSSLDAAIIEAALTHIINHLDDHPTLVAALETTKIGYHDMGIALNDIGVRMFAVQGNKPNSEP